MFATTAARRSNAGNMAIFIIVFVAAASVLSHTVRENAETLLKHRKETLLRAYLCEYNMAIFRFKTEKGRNPESAEELVKFPGGLRRLYADPFTGAADFSLVESSGEVFAVSRSDLKNFENLSYSNLTCDISGKFIKIEKKK